MSKIFSKWSLISLVASLLMAAVMFGSRLITNSILPSEMLFNFIGQLLGVPWVFNAIHNLPWGLDAYAKYALFFTSNILFVVFYYLAARLYPLVAKKISASLAAIAFTIISILGMSLILFPIQGLGAFGLSDNNYAYPVVTSHLWMLLFSAIFSLALYIGYKRFYLQSQNNFDQSKRESLKSIAKLALLASLSGSLLNTLARAQSNATNWFLSLRGISPEITSAKDHYQVSKNVFNPDVKEKNWTLKIKGMVENELSLSLDDIKALPSVERSSTLTCISNKVGGDLIGNSNWTGVKLKYLLGIAKVKEGANELILRGADNYSDSFPIDAAMRDHTILAYLQNGETLTKDHGFPARVLVPGIYGMKNLKWITEIELVNKDYTGYWQSRGWSDKAEIQTMSRIDTKQVSILDDGSAAIAGISFAGIRKI
ncbi:MAG TPA: hypothetical protein ENK21_02525, partial [Trueperaceae bacterium]|nr:hypothetical protein [Trueperaceae bacterium]